MSTAQFKLDMFEGPLDLLLHLISKHKLNIYDIEIAVLLEQYLEYMAGLEEEDYEDAADFLEMAARLIYIKTVSLLPKDNEGEALKKELEGSLIEYSLCKMAASRLAEQYAGGDIFVRTPVKLPVDKTFTGERDPEELLSAYFGMSEKARASKPLRAEMFRPIISKRIVSVTSKIIHVLKKLITEGECRLDNMYDGCADKSERVAVFLAVLELTRSGRIFLNDDNSMVYMNSASKKRRIVSSFDEAELEAERAAVEAMESPEEDTHEEVHTDTAEHPEDTAESTAEEKAERYMPETEFVPLRSVTVHRPSYKSETRYAESSALLTIEIPEEVPEDKPEPAEETAVPETVTVVEAVAAEQEEAAEDKPEPAEEAAVPETVTVVEAVEAEHEEAIEDKPEPAEEASVPETVTVVEAVAAEQEEAIEDKPEPAEEAAVPGTVTVVEAVAAKQEEAAEDKPEPAEETAAPETVTAVEAVSAEHEETYDEPMFRLRPNYYGMRCYWGCAGWSFARLRIR